MAYITQKEFEQAITLLADEHGLHRLRDRFVRLNGLVSRRKLPSARHLADQLYMLSSGLRSEGAPSYAFQAIWSETISEKFGEGSEEQLEPLIELSLIHI